MIFRYSSLQIVMKSRMIDFDFMISQDFFKTFSIIFMGFKKKLAY